MHRDGQALRGRQALGSGGAAVRGGLAVRRAPARRRRPGRRGSRISRDGGGQELVGPEDRLILGEDAVGRRLGLRRELSRPDV